MTIPVSQKFLLNQLSSTGPFFDSAKIIKRANTKYAQALSWIESELGMQNNPLRPTEVLRNCSWKSQAFLLRLSSVRAKIDEIASFLNNQKNSNKNRDNLIVMVEQLSKPFRSYQHVMELGLSNKTLVLAGFDFDNPLTAPFPFVTSAWNSKENSQESNDKYCERMEVKMLFERYMSKDAGAEKCVLRDMPHSIIERIEDCLEFLQEVSPKLLHEVSLNVRHIAMIDFERWPQMGNNEYREIGQSISSHLVPGCCFFSTHSLRSREKLIEALYHEALHKKLSNILMIEPVLCEEYDTETAPRFFSFWNRDTNWNRQNWEFDRALYAFHVYAHLLVFYGAILERPSLNFPRAFAEQQRSLAIERAMALGDWLCSNSNTVLQDRGLVFIESLRQIIKNSIEQHPNPH